MQRVVIVGGGIGGLCAARAVAMAGHEPVVIERSPAAAGAGLLLWPNATRALDALGYGPALRAVAAPARRTVLRDAAGRTLSVLDVEALGRRAGTPMLVIERPALHEVLGEGVPVRFGLAVSTVDATGVTLADGERIEGDAVIGADGIGSVVREYLCPGARAIDTGHTVLRGIADYDIGAGEAFEVWGRGEVVGGVGLPAGRSYWFYGGPSAHIDGQEPLAAISAERWPAPTAAQLDATAPESILVNRILRLGLLPTWTHGTVALLGDAAHAMEPNLGQGAASTIEDAEALLVALQTTSDFAAALTAYAAERRRRAHMLQRESSRMARLVLSTHVTARNLTTRMTPRRIRRHMLEQLMRRHAPRRLTTTG